MSFNLRGNRKFILGLSYLVVCFAISLTAILTTTDGAVALAWAGLPIAISTGVGVVVYGNLRVHQVKGDVDGERRE